MLSSIKKLVSVLSSTESRSVDLVAALEGAQGEVAAAQNQFDVANRAYAEGLLHYSDDDLAALIGDKQKATIRRDRAQLLVSMLETKIANAVEAEAVAALTAERDAAEREAAAVAELVRTEYPKLAKALVSLLTRLESADRAALTVNKKLREAGRSDDVVVDVQRRALPAGRSFNGDAFSVWGSTLLQDMPGFAPGWDALDRERTRHRN